MAAHRGSAPLGAVLRTQPTRCLHYLGVVTVPLQVQWCHGSVTCFCRMLLSVWAGKSPLRSRSWLRAGLGSDARHAPSRGPATAAHGSVRDASPRPAAAGNWPGGSAGLSHVRCTNACWPTPVLPVAVPSGSGFIPASTYLSPDDAPHPGRTRRTVGGRGIVLSLDRRCSGRRLRRPMCDENRPPSGPLAPKACVIVLMTVGSTPVQWFIASAVPSNRATASLTGNGAVEDRRASGVP
jgi:hypothetical protein